MLCWDEFSFRVLRSSREKCPDLLRIFLLVLTLRIYEVDVICEKNCSSSEHFSLTQVTLLENSLELGAIQLSALVLILYLIRPWFFWENLLFFVGWLLKLIVKFSCRVDKIGLPVNRCDLQAVPKREQPKNKKTINIQKLARSAIFICFPFLVCYYLERWPTPDPTSTTLVTWDFWDTALMTPDSLRVRVIRHEHTKSIPLFKTSELGLPTQGCCANFKLIYVLGCC